MSPAFLELTEDYERGERRRRSDWAVAVDGVVREGEMVRRAATGCRRLC